MSELKQAVTQLAHRPAFTAAVVLTLALGIGLNALVFSIVEAVLLRPLPYPAASELMAVWETQPGIATRSVAPANFLDWRLASSFDGMAAFNLQRRSLLGDDPQRITVATVSANYFDVLDVDALHGRTFSAPAMPGATREILVREDFWRHRFGGDPGVAGRTLQLDDESFVVTGVIPTHLAFPEEAVAWMQAPHDIPELGAGAPTDLRTMRDAWYFRVIGRLRDGVSREQAQGELDSIAARLRAAYPSTNRTAGVNVVDLHAQVTGGAARTLWVLFAVAACVLLIACGNVATLLLANALGRRRDLAIRSALGASRWRLVRQLSVESLALALAGAALGLAFASVAGPSAAALLPAGVPRTSGVGADLTVVLFAFAAALLTAVACGAAPALVASRSGFRTLRDGGRSGSSRSGSRFAAALVVGQLAAALVLVTGTGLLLRALWQLHQRDVGIDVARLLAIDVTIPDAQSRGRAAAVIDIERMTERLSSLPGVDAAAAVLTLPLAGRGPSAGFRLDGRVFAPGEAPDVIWKVVTPGYFRTVGLPVVRGRGFVEGDRDGSQPVALVNATLAAMMWPDGDPIGASVGTGLDGSGAPVVVVGVVADTPQEGIAGQVLPEMYRPLAQPARFGVASMAFVVRTAGEPVRLTAAARQAIRDVHPQAPVGAVRPLADVVAAGVANEVTAVRALAGFGGLALVLAAIGLYGVMTRVVGDRTRELGVRLALGAAPGSVRWLVLRRTFGVALTGLALGGGCAVVASRQLGALLHGVSPADPVVLSAASLVLLAVALLAGYLPARHASRIDPLVVLKE